MSAEWRAKRKSKGLPPYNRPNQKAWLKETYYALREALYEILGSTCVECGHADKRVLEFDHRCDDGAIDRRKFNGARSMLEYYVRHADEARARLQCLCRNCNWLKRKGVPMKSAAQLPPPINIAIQREMFGQAEEGKTDDAAGL